MPRPKKKASAELVVAPSEEEVPPVKKKRQERKDLSKPSRESQQSKTVGSYEEGRPRRKATNDPGLSKQCTSNTGASVQNGKLDSPVKKLKALKECENGKKNGKKVKRDSKAISGSESRRSHYFVKTEETETDKRALNISSNASRAKKCKVAHKTETIKPQEKIKADNIKEENKLEISLITDSESDSDFEEVSFTQITPKVKERTKPLTVDKKGQRVSQTKPLRSKSGIKNKSSKGKSEKPPPSKSTKKTNVEPKEQPHIPNIQDFENADESKIADMLLAFEK